MKENFSIGLYKPNAKNNEAFSVEIESSIEPFKAMIKKEKVFLNESTHSFFENNFMPQMWLIQTFNMVLWKRNSEKKKKDNKKICAIQGLVYNFELLNKMNLPIGMMDIDIPIKLIDFITKVFIDKAYETNAKNSLFINQMYVENDFENKGFADYMLKNFPLFLKYVYNINFSNVVISPYGCGKDDKNTQTSAKKMFHLLEKNHYDFSFAIEEGMEFFEKKM